MTSLRRRAKTDPKRSLSFKNSPERRTRLSRDFPEAPDVSAVGFSLFIAKNRYKTGSTKTVARHLHVLESNTPKGNGLADSWPEILKTRQTSGYLIPHPLSFR